MHLFRMAAYALAVQTDMPEAGSLARRMRLLEMTLDPERLIAGYTFNHSPWGTR